MKLMVASDNSTGASERQPVFASEGRARAMAVGGAGYERGHQLRRPYPVGGPALRSWETAVTSCAGANGLVRRMLLGTPFAAHLSALAAVM
jgi:hypothetical protein